jgi:hypothetical protein
MSEFLLVKLLHLIGFAYWLGGDLGVFYSSYIVADDKRSDDVRLTAAKMLFALDQAPRICMTMMLPLGTHLAWKLGVLPLNAVLMGLVWILCFAWLAMVIILHMARPGRGKSLLTTFDFFFRLTLSLGLLAAGLYSLLGPGTLAYWVAAKLAIFGGLVGCGLMVRIKLKPFGPAFANLASGRTCAADNAAIATSLGGTRPFVITIWIGLVANAALGLHLI